MIDGLIIAYSRQYASMGKELAEIEFGKVRTRITLAF